MLKTGFKLLAGLVSGTLVLGGTAVTAQMLRQSAGVQEEMEQAPETDVVSDALSSVEAAQQPILNEEAVSVFEAADTTAADSDQEADGSEGEPDASSQEEAVSVVPVNENQDDSYYEAWEDEDLCFLEAETFGDQSSASSGLETEADITGLEDGKVYLHSLNSGFITAELTGIYSEEFLARIRNGETRLYFTGNAQDADYSLSEIVSFYCSMPEGIRYFEVKDATGTYLELEEPEAELLYWKVMDADAGWKRYADYILESASQMNLYASDRDLVNEINAFICRNYDYEVTNSGMPVFVSTGKGQCWHYAKMFADLCKTVGISAWKVESDTHAWDQVLVDGVTYTFDPTFNDTGQVWTAYSWIRN